MTKPFATFAEAVKVDWGTMKEKELFVVVVPRDELLCSLIRCHTLNI